MSNSCCRPEKLSQENYTYSSNQPKNVSVYILSPVEGYDYSYPYATYKPEKRDVEPSVEEEKGWDGVL